ncbi:hypothetical protein OS188_02905 [Xanthomarina sp. F1114]|uniref:hypothetical protein n=1 Tax=Xanthomarina sp. F1114 TaxID=2996019 RepID=UPI00225E547C|nr:hypothetical protein [Xanthomarina sp. F1114]MCX7546896.1 hypothetical protein [Xanthomarina sp. F1114]
MKNLQMNFKPIILLLLIGFAFSSCSSDDDPIDEPTTGLETKLLACNSFQSNNVDAILLLENRNDGVDYIIDCVVSVEVDLKIEPGVVIEFTDGSGMNIRSGGSLIAEGTQNKMITFTAETKQKGAWKGVISSSQSVRNRLDYVTMEYAGGGQLSSNFEPAILTLERDATFKLNNVTIKNSLNYGFVATSRGYNMELNNVTISDCDIPAYVVTNVVSDISGGDFTGNTTDVIRLSAGTNGAIGTSQTWKNLSVPYRTAHDIIIVDGAQLTLEPGLTLEFEDNIGLELDKIFDDGSSIVAVGTPTEPITFTGATKQAGAWKSLSIRRTSSLFTEFNNVIIEYAGGSGAGGAIGMWVNPVLTVTNTTFKDINGCALFNKYNPTNPNLTQSNNTTENVSGGLLCGE